MNLESIREMYTKRKFVYDQISDYIINVDNRDSESIVKEIIDSLLDLR